MSSMTEAMGYLIQILFDSYASIITLRLLLQLFGANYYNPLSQFTVKLTDPLILPLRKIVPSLKQIDTACIVAILAVLMIKITLLLFISMGVLPHVIGLFILATAQGLDSLLNIFFYSILIMVIISWINPTLRSPVTDILFILTNPLIGRARRMIPDVGGLDLSPLPVIIGLQLMSFLLIRPLIHLGSLLCIYGLAGVK